MARRKRSKRFAEKQVKETDYTDDVSGFKLLAKALGKFFRKSPGEIRANLTNSEWFIYAGMLLLILVVPFLYSRLTTENFLTPKEFVSKMGLAVLGGAFFVKVLLHGNIQLTKTSLDFPIALLFGYCAITVLWNYNAASAIRDLRETFLILMLFPLVVNLVRSRWQVELLLWVVVFAGIATSTLGIMETYNLYFKFDAHSLIHFAKQDILAGKIDPNGFYLPLFPQLASAKAAMASVVSTFGNRNYLGTFSMFTAFIPLAFYFYYRNIFMRGVSLFLYGWMLYGLYITRCRAALIGLVVGMIYMTLMFLVFDKKWKLAKKNIFFFAAIVSIFGLLFLFSIDTIRSTNIWDKIKLTFTLDRKVSNTYERLWVWYGNMQSVVGSVPRWLFGRGFGSFKHFFPKQEAKTYSDKNQDTFTAVTFRQAHNDWIQVISELGIVGLVLLLFVIYRFFRSILLALQRDIWRSHNGEMNGDHVLIIALGAGVVAQLMASVPDFPFHRISTALYAVLFLGLVPVIAETRFFRKELVKPTIKVNVGQGVFFAILIGSAAIASFNYERRSWIADEKVRKADLMLKYNVPANQKASLRAQAKLLLDDAIALDSLPGDPYLKLAAIAELDGKGEEALRWADRAMQNINFNARSTYHSVVFRKLHIYYHLLKKLTDAFKESEIGLALTCGDARSIYYMYLGKIALDITRYPTVPAKQRAIFLKKSEYALEKAKNYPNFALQSKASLAVVKASMMKWKDAYKYASEVSAMVKYADPTMLNIVGISASNLGKNAEAEKALKKVSLMVPTNPVYKRDLGVVYVREKKFGLARKYLEDVYMSPKAPDALKQQVKGTLASMTAFEIGLTKNYLKTNVPEAKKVMTRLLNAKTISVADKQKIMNMGRGIVKFNAEQRTVPIKTIHRAPINSTGQ